MAFLLQKGSEPIERQGMVLSAWEAERQRLAPRRPAWRIPGDRRRLSP